MSSSLARRAGLPQLSPRWTSPDAAAAQGDRNEGQRAAREADPGALDRFWRRLAGDGASDLLRLYGESARLLADHNGRRERLRHELDSDLVGQAAANQRQHDDRAASLRRESGPEAPAFKDSAARAEEAQKSLRSVRAEVNNRPLRTSFGPLYGLMMLLLALAEVPVNRAAFELTFREEPIFSLLLAAAVGIILIFFAHVAGIVLRRWPLRPTMGQVLARVVTLGIMGCVVGAGVFTMAKMRQGFMRLTAAENDGFAERLQEALRGSPQQAVSVMADMPLGIGDYTFIAINVLIFTFGVIASFLRHDPHPDYERAIHEARRSERAFGKLERRYSAALRQETSRYEDHKRALETQMGELRATLASLADQSVGIRDHCMASRQMVAQTIRKRCNAFLEGFSVARDAPEAPSLDAIATELPAPEEAAHAR
jgi:hypothetical protein